MIAYLFLGVALVPGLALALQLDLAAAEQRRTYAPRHRKTSCEAGRRRHRKSSCSDRGFQPRNDERGAASVGVIYLVFVAVLIVALATAAAR